ncbi:MAG: clostripain-related cysteine peptidase, partial [Pelobacteraceae bacterium]
MAAFSACGGGGGTNSGTTNGNGSGTTGQPKWTYMVYLAADNNLAAGALMDLLEMETVGSSAGVNVVVQAKLSPTELVKAGITGLAIDNSIYRAKIVKSTNANSLESVFTPVPGISNMADKTVLTGFIQWAKQNYPADNYALVLWSHGNGWKTIPISQGLPTRGALADDSNNSLMTMQDIATAIKNSGVHFGIVNFDACLMAMYEVAYSLKDVADYLVASEEVEPGQGDDYNRVLTSLTGTPGQTPNQVARMLATTYKEFYVSLGSQGKDSVTKSAIDLSQIGVFKTAMDDVAVYLTQNLTTSSSLRPAIQSARNATGTLSFNSINRDLGLFLDALKNGTTNDATLGVKLTAARSALSAAVIKNESYSPSGAQTNLATVTGMSIFLPRDGEYLDTDFGAYQALGSTLDSSGWKWSSFLSQLLTGTTAPKVTTRGDFGFAISWDNPNADLDLYVAEPFDLASPWIGTTSPNGYLTADSYAGNSSYEAYVAQSSVAAGVYDLFINNFSNTATKVTLWYIDPTKTDWVQLWVKQMNACTTKKDAFPAPGTADYTDLTNHLYCDWIYDPGVGVINNTYDLNWWVTRSQLNKAVLLPNTSKHKIV